MIDTTVLTVEFNMEKETTEKDRNPKGCHETPVMKCHEKSEFTAHGQPYSLLDRPANLFQSNGQIQVTI